MAPAFVLALLLGGRVTPTPLNRNSPGPIATFNDADCKLLIEEGRRQLDSQADRFKHTTDRAQVLLTASLVVVAFVAGILHRVSQAGGRHGVFALAIWAAGAAFTIVGLAAAASVIVVRADFDAIDTTVMSNWEDRPILQKLAGDYAKVVVLGETTIAARVTMFRLATRLVCWGAIFVAVAFCVAAWA